MDPSITLRARDGSFDRRWIHHSSSSETPSDGEIELQTEGGSEKQQRDAFSPTSMSPCPDKTRFIPWMKRCASFVGEGGEMWELSALYRDDATYTSHRWTPTNEKKKQLSLNRTPYRTLISLSLALSYITSFDPRSSTSLSGDEKRPSGLACKRVPKRHKQKGRCCRSSQNGGYNFATSIIHVVDVLPITQN